MKEKKKIDARVKKAGLAKPDFVENENLARDFPDKRIAWLFPVSIFLFAFLIYSNTLNHGFVMDDGAVITDNITVQKGFQGIGELFQQSSVYGSTKENYGNYRPVTMTFFAVGKQLFGNDSSKFHLIQVLLYALCCTIAFLTLKKLLRNYHPLLPFVAVLLFVAHPVHTEVGAFIKSTDETLSLIFCSAALLFAVKFATSGGVFNAIVSGVFFLISLFSKESAVTFLFVIPHALFLFTSASGKQIIKLTAFYLSSVLFYLFIRSIVLSDAPAGISIINNSLSGATSLNEKFGTIFYILFRYARLLVFPDVLSWDYGYNEIPLVTFANALVLLSVLFHVGIIVYAIFVLKTLASDNKSKLLSRIVAFAILFYFATLSTSLNIVVPIASTMGERFLFTPSVAFSVVLAILILKLSGFDLTKRKTAPIPQRRNYLLAVLILCPILILYSIRTRTRNPEWKSNYTLFESGALTSPNSYRTNATFGWENLKAGEMNVEMRNEYYTKAKYYFQKAISIYGKEANDWYNLGVSNYQLGDTNAAIIAYQKAIEVYPNHTHSKSCFNLGAVFFNRKDYEQALKYFQCAYSGDPSMHDAFFKSGVCLHYLGDIKSAIAVFEKHLTLNPGNHDAIQNLVVEYAMIGDLKKSEFYSAQLANKAR